MLELEGGRARHFDGPWHAWRTERAQRALAAGREVERSQAEIARMERFVERFRYKATKARQAQSKLKRIERVRRSMPAGEATDSRRLAFSFGAAERSGRVVLELDAARIDVGGRTLIEDAELWLERGEHVCLIGPNGSGKSTLIATLTGERPLGEGVLRGGHNVKLGHLRQHAEPPSSSTATVLAHAQRRTGLSEARTRALLGRFLFSGEEVEKPVGGISGGEAQRLALAILVSSDSNLLVLDEPTNHLDAESREALEEALLGFDGTILLVSHDRALLEAVGNRTLVIEDGRLRSHPGGWVEYRAGEQAKREAGDRDRKPKPEGRARDRGPSKNRQALIERLEGEVERAEADLRALEDELADPSHWADERSSRRASRRHEQAKARLRDAEAEWERTADSGD